MANKIDAQDQERALGVAAADMLHLGEAFVKFGARLETAGVVFFQRKDAGRLGTMMALEAVTCLIEEFDDLKSEQLHAPFVVLTGALGDLERGVVHRMFEAALYDRKAPRKTMEEARIVSSAAIAMDLLMKSGDFDKDRAAARVAKAFQKADIRYGKNEKSINKQMVKSFRDRATHPNSTDPAVDSFRYIKQQLKDLHIANGDFAGDVAGTMAENLLQMIASGRLFTSFRPRAQYQEQED